MNIKKFILEDNCNKDFAYLIIFQKEEESEKIQNCISKTMEKLPAEYTDEDILQDLEKQFEIEDIIDLYNIVHFEY